jgi:hypothetical protein
MNGSDGDFERNAKANRLSQQRGMNPAKGVFTSCPWIDEFWWTNLFVLRLVRAAQRYPY